MMVLRTGVIHPSKKSFRLQDFLSKILAVIGRPIFLVLLSVLYFFYFFTGLITRLFYINGLLKLIRATRFSVLFLQAPIQLLSTHLNVISSSLKNLLPFQIPSFSLIRSKKSLVLLLLIASFIITSAWWGYWAILKDLPNPNKLVTTDPILTTKIYDRNNKLLYKIYRNQNRTLVPLEETPLFLRQAIIAIEDKDFYYHQGFSLTGIGRAVYRNLFQGKLSGGSTITQQLVKNTLLTSQRTWKRKMKEIILALWVETKFSKDQILKMYINEVGFGGATYGVEEASQYYFGKSVKNLNLAEATLLAGLPISPTRHSPFGAHPELAKERQEQVLRRMVEDGYITPLQEEETRKQVLTFAPHHIDIQAPHFVMYIKELLVQKYGEKMVNEGGLEVKTSLDLDIQNMAQKITKEEVDKLRNLNVTNGAALVTNPKTGEILAMVGSKDYFDIKNNGNFNVTTAARQPGSSIKPVNYAVALSMGFTPATVIPDTPITYRVPNQPAYTPKNYDNRFHGNVTLRTALASSYNVPAIKVLSSIGVSRMIDKGRQLGITTWDDPSKYGLSLTLGGGEVKMVDLSVVYGTLANLGMRVDLHPFLEVRNFKGEVMEELTPPYNATPILNPNIAYILSDILSDNSARTPTFGHNSLLVIPNKTVAVKTGTTNNLKDNWTIGYTPSALVAVWVGNNDNSPMSYIASGITGASPIWRNIMLELLKNKPDEKFQVPQDLVKAEICTLTNTLSCNACPYKKTEFFLPGTQPNRNCTEDEVRSILQAQQQNDDKKKNEGSRSD